MKQKGHTLASRTNRFCFSKGDNVRSNTCQWGHELAFDCLIFYKLLDFIPASERCRLNSRTIVENDNRFVIC